MSRYRRWIINTESDDYKRHHLRWQGRVNPEETGEDDNSHWGLPLEQEPGEDDLQSIFGPLSPRREAGPFTFIRALQLATREHDVTEFWPELCTLLEKQGLTVFVNGLTTPLDASWQWQWGVASGSNCASKKEAILAALMAMLNTLPASALTHSPSQEDLPKTGFFGGWR